VSCELCGLLLPLCTALCKLVHCISTKMSRVFRSACSQHTFFGRSVEKLNCSPTQAPVNNKIDKLRSYVRLATTVKAFYRVCDSDLAQLAPCNFSTDRPNSVIVCYPNETPDNIK
jgi:hypothetical protein